MSVMCWINEQCSTTICCRGICKTACATYDPVTELFADHRLFILFEIALIVGVAVLIVWRVRKNGKKNAFKPNRNARFHR
jgi:hypothetical protein